MISMDNWRDQCCRVICNFTAGAAMMTGPMKMYCNSDVSRKCAMSRLQGARRIALRAVKSIDALIADLARLG